MRLARARRRPARGRAPPAAARRHDARRAAARRPSAWPRRPAVQPLRQRRRALAARHRESREGRQQRPAIDSPSTWVKPADDAAAAPATRESWPRAAAHSASGDRQRLRPGRALALPRRPVPRPRAGRSTAGARRGPARDRRRQGALQQRAGESPRGPGAPAARERARQRGRSSRARPRGCAASAEQLPAGDAGQPLGLRGAPACRPRSGRSAASLRRHLGLNPRERSVLGERVPLRSRASCCSGLQWTTTSRSKRRCAPASISSAASVTSRRGPRLERCRQALLLAHGRGCTSASSRAGPPGPRTRAAEAGAVDRAVVPEDRRARTPPRRRRRPDRQEP